MIGLLSMSVLFSTIFVSFAAEDTKTTVDNINEYLKNGDNYYQRGDYDQAISDYNKAIKIRPDGSAYFERAFVYFLIKQYDKSWEDVHKAESLGSKLDQKFLEQLKKASGREK